MINDNFIRDFLINYWDSHGSLDYLSTNCKKIYSLILDRRRKEEKEYAVNDYIYHALGIQNIGVLGEELSFEIGNHLTKYHSLANRKEAPFYGRLKKIADTLEVEVDDVLLDAGCKQYLDAPITIYSYRELNTYYMVFANTLKMGLPPNSKVFLDIHSYWESKRSFSTFCADCPELASNLLNAFNASYAGNYQEEITNADALFTNKKFYTKDCGRTAIGLPSQEYILTEVLYYLMGYEPTRLLSPSMIYALKCHESYHKTLYNLHKTNPSLYSSLRSVFLTDGTYTSLKEMLEAEGFYYPELTTEAIQFLPCSDMKHAVCVLNSADTHFVVDKPVLSYIFANNVASGLEIAYRDGVPYVNYASKKGRKSTTAPLHTLVTGENGIFFKDGNFLNVSFDNLQRIKKEG